MRQKFVLILLLSLVVTFAHAKRWSTNKDSVIVDAQYSNEEDENPQADEPTGGDKAECYTSDGEPGECVTVIRCHPILFSEKGQLRNAGLALTYAQTEDVCATKNNVDGRSSSEDVKSSGTDSQIGQKVICCARDRIQYNLRSDVNEDLEVYTTTTASPPLSDPIVVTTVVVPIAEEVVPQTTYPPTVGNSEDEIVVVENYNIKSQSGPVVEFDVEETVTTQQPHQVLSSVVVDSEEPIAEVEPLPEVENETQKPAPAPIDVSTATSVPAEIPEEPEVQPEVIPEEEVIQQAPPTNACTGTDSYNQWPVFQDYPWLATIQTRAKTGPTCSGSLITESHVLCAAHCLHRFNSRDVARMHIRIGFTKRSTNDTFNDYYVARNASKIIFHRRFHEQSKMDNNIALIKLDEPVEFDDHIAPIGVFNGLGGFDVGNCTAAEAGWIKFGNRKVTGISQGVIHFIEAPMSDFHLRESLSRVLNNEECAEQLNSQINEKMICARSKLFEEPNVSTDFFRWNDGGPLVVKVGNMIQQIGIKSWAYEGQQYPTVYTKVDSYLDWIRNNLKM